MWRIIGQPGAIRPKNRKMRPDWKSIREYDPLLILSAVLLTVIGIVLIYSAQHNAPNPADRAYWSRQLLWFGVALVGFLVAVKIPLRFHEVFAYVYLAIIAAVLIGLAVLGQTVGGRWVSLGPAYLQPSELAKLAVLFALSRYLAYLKQPVFGFRPLLTVAALVGPVALLVLKQPDLGTALVFCAMTLVLLFWGGVPPIALFFLVSPVISLILAFNWIAWVAFAVVLFAALIKVRPRLLVSVTVFTVNLAFGVFTPILWNSLHAYQQNRILVFLNPGVDPRGAGYQIIQSKVAIGSGGFWGKGFLEGTQTGLHFLPAKHTDFVFSVLGEEFGFVGAVIVLALFGVLLWRAIIAGYVSRNRFGRFLAVGAAGIIGFQLLVNVGMTVGLMPVTGIPLPFVSYGGTSLVLFWFLIGLIVNVRRNWQEY
ncbi:MAG: rod shape-determining protein RodA [candidate division Zixibacteria bacterium]|nr:rod shape-determining protein RodA [candidate division Zixibacteria bacterium]